MEIDARPWPARRWGVAARPHDRVSNRAFAPSAARIGKVHRSCDVEAMHSSILFVLKAGVGACSRRVRQIALPARRLKARAGPAICPAEERLLNWEGYRAAVDGRAACSGRTRRGKGASVGTAMRRARCPCRFSGTGKRRVPLGEMRVPGHAARTVKYVSKVRRSCDVEAMRSSNPFASEGRGWDMLSCGERF